MFTIAGAEILQRFKQTNKHESVIMTSVFTDRASNPSAFSNGRIVGKPEKFPLSLPRSQKEEANGARLEQFTRLTHDSSTIGDTLRL